MVVTVIPRSATRHRSLRRGATVEASGFGEVSRGGADDLRREQRPSLAKIWRCRTDEDQCWLRRIWTRRSVSDLTGRGRLMAFNVDDRTAARCSRKGEGRWVLIIFIDRPWGSLDPAERKLWTPGFNGPRGGL
ncbi:hypothetical protein M6B38_404255 [Iris pallida]|uniref:Uncharacterized protein n=1 Tax=Iris pallida TaxID=29817 RepID=A0AAX6FRE0_IRIPA|nr:hypothetical protein M6B38_404255 [Iris pallida]